MCIWRGACTRLTEVGEGQEFVVSVELGHKFIQGGAVHDIAEAKVCLVDAVVRDAVLREVVCAYSLRAVTGSNLLVALHRPLLLDPQPLGLVDARPQHLQRLGLVLHSMQGGRVDICYGHWTGRKHAFGVILEYMEMWTRTKGLLCRTDSPCAGSARPAWIPRHLWGCE